MAEKDSFNDDVIIIESDNEQINLCQDNENKKNVGTDGTTSVKNNEREARLVYIGNPPTLKTEEVLRKEFSAFGDIVGYVEYQFRGSLNVHIEYDNKDSIQKALTMHLAVVEGHRLRVNVCGKFSKRLRDVVVIMLEDPNVTEDELFSKYCKDTKLLYVNKIFPHAYLVFADQETRSLAVLKYRAEGIKVHEPQRDDMIRHSHLLSFQNIFPMLRNTVTVTNISDQTQESEIRSLFHKYGEIIDKIEIKKYGYQSASVVLKFENKEIAAQTTELNNSFFNGRRIHVQYGDKDMIPNYEYSVFVEKIWSDNTEEEIYDIFQQFGEIQQVARQHLRPYQVLIEFKEKSSVENAITLKHLTRKNGVNIDVKVYRLKGPFYIIPNGVQRLPASKPKESKFPEIAANTKCPTLNNFAIKDLHKYTPLYVSNLPKDVDKAKIVMFFNQYSPVHQLIFMENKNYFEATITQSRIALVYFNTRVEAEKTMAQTDQKMFQGKRLNVILARPNFVMRNERLVKVTELSKIATEESLYTEFEKCGPIERLVKSNSSTAYILFKDEASKEAALKRNFNEFEKTIMSKIKVSHPSVLVEFKLEIELIGRIEKNLQNLKIALQNEKKSMTTSSDEEVLRLHRYMITGKYEVSNKSATKNNLEKKESEKWSFHVDHKTRDRSRNNRAGISSDNTRMRDNLINFRTGNVPIRGNNMPRDSRMDNRDGTMPVRGNIVQRDNAIDRRGVDMIDRNNTPPRINRSSFGPEEPIAKKSRPSDVTESADVQMIDKKTLEKLLEMAFNSGKNVGENRAIEKYGFLPESLIKSRDDSDSVHSNTSQQRVRSGFSRDPDSFGGYPHRDVPMSSSFRDQMDTSEESARKDSFSRNVDVKELIRDQPIRDSFGGREQPLRDSFGGREHPLRDSFGGREHPLRDSFEGRENSLRDSFGGREKSLRDSFGGRDQPTRDSYGDRKQSLRDTLENRDSYQRNIRNDDSRGEFIGFSKTVDDRLARIDDDYRNDDLRDSRYGARRSRNFDDELVGRRSYNDNRDSYNNYMDEMQSHRNSSPSFDNRFSEANKRNTDPWNSKHGWIKGSGNQDTDMDIWSRRNN